MFLAGDQGDDSLWCDERFEAAFAVTGRGLNLVTSPQGMIPNGRAHLAATRVRVVALLTEG